MSRRRAIGSKHPSVVEKIHDQPSLLTKNCSSKSFTSGMCQYLNGGQQSSLLPACRWASSVEIPPLVFVGAPTEKRNNPLPIKLCIGFLHMVNMTAAAPIRRVNFLIQSQNEMIKSGRLLEPYKGKLNCFTRVIKNEGIISMWRGNGVDVIRTVVSAGVQTLAFDDHLKSIVTCYKMDKDVFWKWFAGTSLALGLNSATSLLATYPLHYAHTRLANDIKNSRESKTQFDGLVDVCKKTLRSDGIAGIYRGYNVAVLERIFNIWAFIGIHKVTKPPLFLEFLGLQNDPLVNLIVAGGVLFVANLATYPMNTICRRMMMTCGEAVKYKSSVDAFSQILKKEGFASLYKGVDAYILAQTVTFGPLLFTFFVLERLVSAKKKGSGGGDQSSPRKIDIKWRTG